MPILPTWGGGSEFEYKGSVESGTDITYGKKRKIRVEAHKYAALRSRFRGREVPVSTSRTNPRRDSLGAWLQVNVTGTAIASYVAPILVHENYAERIGEHDIHVTR